MCCADGVGQYCGGILKGGCGRWRRWVDVIFQRGERCGRWMCWVNIVSHGGVEYWVSVMKK